MIVDARYLHLWTRVRLPASPPNNSNKTVMKRTLITAMTLFLCSFNVFAEVIFSDLDEDDISYAAAVHLQKSGIIDGYEDGTFRPDEKVNRAEFLKMVLAAASSDGLFEGEIAGEGCFNDVESEWFSTYVCAAYDQGFVDGYEDGYFRPEQGVNFAEASKIVSNVFQVEFDFETQENWFEPYVVILEKKNAIPDTIMYFDQELTRGDVACILSDFMVNESVCASNLTYAKLKGVSQLADQGEITKLDLQSDNMAFYELQGELHVVDVYGKIHLIENVDIDSFRVFSGTSHVNFYFDDDGAYYFDTNSLQSNNEDYRIRRYSDLIFDMETIEYISEETPSYYSYDWSYFKDKDYLYLAISSEGNVQPSDLVKLEGFDKDDFSVFQNLDRYSFVLNSGELYLIGLEKGYLYSSEDIFVHKLDEVDLESFEIMSANYFKDANNVYMINYLAKSIENEFYYMEKGEGFVVLEDIDAETFEIVQAFDLIYEFGGDYVGYYLRDEDEVWVVDRFADVLDKFSGEDAENFDYKEYLDDKGVQYYKILGG